MNSENKEIVENIEVSEVTEVTEIKNEIEIEKLKEEEGQSISTHVKQASVSMLMDMGFSKNVSEKACFFNQSDVEKSVDWINNHCEDADLEEELKIVGTGSG